MRRTFWTAAWAVCVLWAATVTIVCAAASSPAVAGPAEPARYEYTRIEMGVPFRILLYAADETSAKRASDAAFARIRELNKIMSDYDSESELSHLSRAAPTEKPFPVSLPLWHVLSRAQQLAATSDGAFDVTVGPYVRLWRRARRSGEFPSKARLAEAREAVGYRHLQLHQGTQSVTLTRPHMRLDLGGIAIGYAVDEALAVLDRHGICRAMVDASGDIAATGPPPLQSGWRIAIAPREETGSPRCYLRLAHGAVTTSGDALQHVIIDGRRYSHIVDPRTGLGLTDQSSVTVVARDCITADSLATAVSVLGPEAGLKLICKTPGAAALVVRKTNGKREEVCTPNWRKLGCGPR